MIFRQRRTDRGCQGHDTLISTRLKKKLVKYKLTKISCQIYVKTVTDSKTADQNDCYSCLLIA